MNLLRSIFYAVCRMMCLRTPRLPHASHWQNNRVACLLRPSPEDRDTDAEVWSPNSYTRGPTATPGPGIFARKIQVRNFRNMTRGRFYYEHVIASTFSMQKRP